MLTYFITRNSRPSALSRSMIEAYKKRLISYFLSLLFTFCAIGSLPSQAQDYKPFIYSNPPILTLSAGLYVIHAELANTEETRRKGLMFRQSLDKNSGMLFVFDVAEVQCFWMRNTPLPLTIAFLTPNGNIVNMADMQPYSEDTHCSKEPVRYALEMPQGWFAQRDIKVGQVINNLPR